MIEESQLDTALRREMERKLAEEKAKTEDLLETTRLINSGISHELRTPLQAIRSVIEIIQEVMDKHEGCQCPSLGCSVGEFLEDLELYLDDARRASDYAISVLNALAAYARSNMPERAEDMEVFKELHSFYHTMKLMEPFKELEQEEFILTLPGLPGVCELDKCFIHMRAVEFQQVIHNLCKNAIEAIDFDTVEPHVEIKLNILNEYYVEIRVIDNGRGISNENRPHIFKPYFTTKDTTRDNRGLGLSIVKNIIKTNGGNIRFDTRQGRTEFIITFPCSMYKED